MDHLIEFRKKLDLPSRTVYLNTAATGPTSRPVRNAMAAYELDRARRGEAGWEDWLKDVDSARASTAEFFRARPDEVAFLSNTGHGINTVANMLSWKRGDEIVTTNLEFPSNRLPWMRLQGQGVEVNVANAGLDGFLDVAAIEKLITDRTRLVAVSWVSYRNGQRLQLRRLADAAHRHGAHLLVDGIQGAGAVRPDFTRDGVDFWANGAHKWLMAPFGVGAFLVRRDLVAKYDPPLPGWFSVEDPEAFATDAPRWAATARRFEAGNLNFGGIAGWNASMELFRDLPGAEARVLRLSKRILERAASDGIPVHTPSEATQRAGIVVVGVKDPSRTAASLARRGIQVAVRGAGLRIAAHFWNLERETDAVMDALAQPTVPKARPAPTRR